MTTPSRYRPGASAENIIRVLARFYGLTARQVTALLFAPSSASYAGEQLKLLTTHGYAVVDRLPGKAPGNKLGVWFLSGKGQGYAKELGEPVPPRVHTPLEYEAP